MSDSYWGSGQLGGACYIHGSCSSSPDLPKLSHRVCCVPGSLLSLSWHWHWVFRTVSTVSPAPSPCAHQHYYNASCVTHPRKALSYLLYVHHGSQGTVTSYLWGTLSLPEQYHLPEERHMWLEKGKETQTKGLWVSGSMGVVSLGTQKRC